MSCCPKHTVEQASSKSLNYDGSPNFGVTPSKNTVPIQTVANSIDLVLGTWEAWTGLSGVSDDIVPLDSQAAPPFLSYPSVSTVIPENLPSNSHSPYDREFLFNRTAGLFMLSNGLCSIASHA